MGSQESGDGGVNWQDESSGLDAHPQTLAAAISQLNFMAKCIVVMIRRDRDANSAENIPIQKIKDDEKRDRRYPQINGRWNVKRGWDRQLPAVTGTINFLEYRSNDRVGE